MEQYAESARVRIETQVIAGSFRRSSLCIREVARQERLQWLAAVDRRVELRKPAAQAGLKASYIECTLLASEHRRTASDGSKEVAQTAG
jgi:hypothetical protein